MTTATAKPQLPDFDFQPAPYDGPSRKELIERRKKVLNQGIFTLYQEPLMLVQGKMQYVWDETGHRYLDLFGGICTVSVGHCHPEVNEAVKKQYDLIQHAPTVYLHPTVVEYAEKLAATLPDPLNRVYFVNSGSEANDLAILMARLHTGNYDIISLRNCYHGGNAVGMSLTSHHTWKYNIPPLPGFQHAKAPHPVHGLYSYDDPEVGTKYALEIQELIQFGTPGALAAFIAEPIQGVGGAVEYPAGYLKKVYETVRGAGGICIADEVQTGFGRTGDHFWGFQNHDVVPDMVTMAKSIGNGFPLAAVVTTDEIAEKMAGRIHFNTYGGDPIAMAQGMATLDIMLRDNIQGHCKKMGDILLQGLTKLQERYPQIASVRGKGLMLGIEFVEKAGSTTPGSALCAQFMEKCREYDVLVGKGGLFGSTIRLKPPMCINEADARYFLEIAELVLSEITA